MEKEARMLALFDFDGTLTRKDTLLEVIKFIRGKNTFYLGMCWLSPYLILFKIKLLSNWKAKEKLMTYFLAGMQIDHFQQCCDKFITEKLPMLLKRDGVKMLQLFKEQHRDIAIVSASAENWIAPWCEKMGIRCIATKLEIKEGKLTGKMKGENCHGNEKVKRIREMFDLSTYQQVDAFGDSKGDIPMLKIATHAHYREFKGK